MSKIERKLLTETLRSDDKDRILKKEESANKVIEKLKETKEKKERACLV